LFIIDLIVKRSNQLYLYIIVLISFITRIANLSGESLWRDEIDSIRFAFEPLGDMLAKLTREGFNGPLYNLVLRGWLSLSGINDFALRYLSLVCGVLLVVLIFALGSRWFNERVGRYAALFTAVSPVLTWYAGEGKMYSMQPALLVLALYALTRAVSLRANNSPMTWWTIFVAATSLSFYVHLLSPLFLAVPTVFFFENWVKTRRRLKGTLISLALLTLPYLPLLAWQLPKLIEGGDIGHTPYPLDLIARTLALNWTLGLDNLAPFPISDVNAELLDTVRYVCVVLFCGLALVGFFAANASRISNDRSQVSFMTRLTLLTWFALPTLLLFLISQRIAIFQPRYVLWCAPALYLLMAVGIENLKMRVALRGLAIGVVAISLLGWVGQVIRPIRPDLRGAVASVLQHAKVGDAMMFQIPYGRFGFEHYARHADTSRFALYDAPFTNNGESEEEVALQLQPVTDAHNRIWLYETEASMWDERGLVRAQFDSGWKPVERIEFRGVTLSLYQAP
jgi:mannosyltransferase